MKGPKSGFTPLKISTLVVTGIALVVHIAAVAYPVWDQIDAAWKVPHVPVFQKIQASGSLWDFTKKVDETHVFFPPVFSKKYTEWKEPIKLMELTAIGVGAISIVLLIMSTFIDRRISNYVILLLSRMVAITALMCTSLDIMLGAMLYKYQFKKTASNYASDVNLGYPIDKFELQMGWILECAAGGLFLMATLIAMAESLHNPPSKATYSKSVVPFEEKTNSNNNKNKEEEKKENKKGKLVVEDIDENPGKKS